MTLKEAVTILKSHQDWRVGKTDDCPCTPRELTEAINLILNKFDFEKWADFSEEDETQS